MSNLDYRDENLWLMQGDCLERMKEIPDGGIDLTVTSPPYDNLRSYNGNIELWGEHVWREVIRELYRVTASGGVVVWVVGDATIKGSETGTSFKQALWAMECGFRLHDTMIYHKNALPKTTTGMSRILSICLFLVRVSLKHSTPFEFLQNTRKKRQPDKTASTPKQKRK